MCLSSIMIILNNLFNNLLSNNKHIKLKKKFQKYINDLLRVTNTYEGMMIDGVKHGWGINYEE